MRTNTVGRLRSPEGWSIDFGIADTDGLLHASVDRARPALARRRAPALGAAPGHTRDQPQLSDDALAPGSCIDDGDLRAWDGLILGHSRDTREVRRHVAEQGYANPAALVSTQWVADHLNDAERAAASKSTSTPRPMAQGHIQGAVGCQLDHPARRPHSARHSVRKRTGPKLLGQAGVGPDTRIVFYGDNNNWFAAFAYWVSKIYGHQNSALMNGGRKKWELEGRPLTTDAPAVSASTLLRRATRTSTYRAFLQRRARSRRPARRWSTCARPPSSAARSSPRPA